MSRYYCLYLLLLLIMTVSRCDCMYVKLLPVCIYKLISYTYWVGSSFLATYFSGDRSHWLATLTLSGAVVFIRWVSRDFWSQSFWLLGCKYSGLLSGFVFKSCGMIFLEVMYTRTCSEGKYYFWWYILSFVTYNIILIN